VVAAALMHLAPAAQHVWSTMAKVMCLACPRTRRHLQTIAPTTNYATSVRVGPPVKSRQAAAMNHAAVELVARLLFRFQAFCAMALVTIMWVGDAV